ncbi:MAG TPA: chemotaxis protein CheA [Gammaproteobacteria bacterium]|nr:chemotaxis protein CheA [Gammaproteobacteria bacterium]
MDDEILQDFLVEAQEILENLDSQLIELEGAPEDKALLNAIFRGFHTIKGGAGFLSLEPLVEVAHKAEDVFDLLRNGKRALDAATMDVFLQVLDTLRAMFGALHAGSLPDHAEPALIAALRGLAAGETLPEAGPASGAVPAAQPAASAAAPAAGGSEFDEVVAGMMAEEAADPSPAGDLITDDEFEHLLDKLQGEGRGPIAAPATEARAELITDDEFEALLDKLQGEGRGPVVAPPAAAGDSKPALISDEEFDKLLDELHGPGRFEAHAVAVPAAPVPQAPPAPATAKPAAPKAADAKAQDGNDAQAKDNTIRVGTDVLDRIMNMVGELVLIRNRLSNLQASVGNAEVTQAVASLDVVTSDLQMAAMKTRMQPIKKVFGRFPRVVRDLARSLKKEIELEMAGEETDLDKTLVEALSDPLVHLVRNAVDHGIETPDLRVAAGKPRQGRLKLAAEQDGDQILLTIEDDGKGMNADVLRAKSVEKGLLEQDAALRLSERECFELIFLPGFSTKEEISDVSGRGVGMDVVKTRITQLNGSIEIDSKIGVGTTIRIRVPLTLAIMPTLMVVLGQQIFALPLVNVKEIIDFKRSQAREVNGSKTLVVRGKALPLFYLSRWLVQGVHDYAVDEGHVVIVSVGSQMLGLIVDELIGQEEVVIKPLGAMLHGTKGLSGATITGNGRIALILDLPELIDAYARR